MTDIEKKAEEYANQVAHNECEKGWIEQHEVDQSLDLQEAYLAGAAEVKAEVLRAVREIRTNDVDAYGTSIAGGHLSATRWDALATGFFKASQAGRDFNNKERRTI